MITALILTQALSAKTDLSFTRHCETVANATGVYNSKTLNQLSEKGLKQLKTLTEKLLTEKPYDVIYVSPSARALKTIQPYLVKTGKKAIVWPLLYECCTQKRPSGAHATSFSYGSKFSIPKAMEGLFIIKKGWEKLPNSPDYNSGLAQVQATLKELPGLAKGKRVLLVGHSGHGGQILKSLTGKAIHVENAKLMKVAIKP